MRYFKKMIVQYIDIEEGEWKYISSKFEKRVVHKDNIIHNGGDIFSR